MSQKFKAVTRIILCLSLPALVLLMLFFLVNFSPQSSVVRAQEPIDDKLPSIPIDEETLAAFGLSVEDIHITSAPFDLVVVKKTNVTSVTSGESVTFNISITNTGTNLSSYFEFYDDYPTQLQNPNFSFSIAPLTSDDKPKPKWLFNPLPSGGVLKVTVTGILTSGPNVTVRNTAIVTPYSVGEITPTNNTSAVNVDIIGYSPMKMIFLPLINKAPPRVLVYSDDFSNSSSGWTTVDDSNCNRSYKDNEYQLVADANESCFTPAPAKAEYTYGEFQVSARVSDGDGNFDYGIYINGAGGDNHYLFRVKPDDECGWRLVRRKSGTSTTIGSGGCVAAINEGAAKNTLTIKHDKNGTMTLYINGTQIFSINDGNSLTGKGTGLFVEADDTKDITVRFDDFRVYTVP